MKIPPEVQMKAALSTNNGRPTLVGPGKLENVDLNPYRAGRREQELVFALARDLTREYVASASCEAPTHVLFPQLVHIVQRFMRDVVRPVAPAHRLDVFLSPYYGWAIERLVAAIRPDVSEGEVPEIPRYEMSRGPGSTGEVDYWTSKEVREVLRSHLNVVVADTKKWEQSAAYILDAHPVVAAFVKNAGLGFAIPYLHNGRGHFDELADVKAAAAERWVSAVNADGQFGSWRFAMARSVGAVREILDTVSAAASTI